MAGHRTRWAVAAVTVSLPLAALLAAAPVGAQSPSAAPEPSCAPVPSTAPLPSAAPASAVPAGDLTVFAAASLTKAFGDLQAPWAAAHPDSTLVFSFDASGALRTQIEQGAPADVLASADMKNPQALVDECLAPAPVTAFATNHLVIVVPKGNPAGITSPADLTKSGVKVVAAGKDVPITKYATQLVDTLSKLSGYPADFAAGYAANVVSEEDNVKAVLAKIELGEGDAAIVYVTDAASSTGVDTVAVPDEANVLATYGAVSITDSAQPELSAEFLSFLTGPDAQAVLASYGFLPPPAN
ncbi:MAG: molybdate ABC transporter substrate-binding protein [Chloroflexota bacterium]